MFKISIKRRDDAPPDDITLYQHYCNVYLEKGYIRLRKHSDFSTIYICNISRHEIYYNEARVSKDKVFPNESRKLKWVQRKLRDKASKKYKIICLK